MECLHIFIPTCRWSIFLKMTNEKEEPQCQKIYCIPAAAAICIRETPERDPKPSGETVSRSSKATRRILWALASLNKQRRWGHNGAAWCTSTWERTWPLHGSPAQDWPPWCCRCCRESSWRRISVYKLQSINRTTPFISSLIFSVWSNLDGRAGPWPLIQGSLWAKMVPDSMKGARFSPFSVCLFLPLVLLTLHLWIAAIWRPFKTTRGKLLSELTAEWRLAKGHEEMRRKPGLVGLFVLPAI